MEKRILFVVIALFLVSACAPVEEQDQPEMVEPEAEVEPEPAEMPPVDSNVTVLATVNGVEVTSDDVSAIQMAMLQHGQQVSDQDALEQLINQQVLVETVKDAGLLPMEEIEALVMDSLAEQNVTLNDYKQQLAGEGYSYEQQLEGLQLQLSVQNFLESALKNADLNVSDEEARELYDQLANQSEDVPSFEEAKDQVKLVLQQRKQQEAVQSLSEQLREKIEIVYK